VLKEMRMKLTNEEKETLKSYEKGERSSMKKLAAARRQLQQYAKNAVQDGLPYQTLISSVLHKFINERLVERVAD
jgi:predicted DNA binding CopG/RHH family protein